MHTLVKSIRLLIELITWIQLVLYIRFQMMERQLMDFQMEYCKVDTPCRT